MAANSTGERTGRRLEPAQHPILARALGDTPETVHSIHLLARDLCRAYVAGDPAHYEGAIVQATAWPEEPAGFGSDARVLWELLQEVEGWICLLVDAECARPLGEIIEAEMGRGVWTLDDVNHALSEPARVYEDGAVRRLTPADAGLLEAAPLELRSSLWPGPRELLDEGIVACAILSGEIVATALTTAYSDRYADIGVYTREEVRGRGYATAAASQVARGVQQGGRVPVWGAGGHNAASLRVARKLGFREVSRRTYVVLKEQAR